MNNYDQHTPHKPQRSGERPNEQGNNIRAQCCITGGGPAGLVMGYLLARQGVDIIVLEKHADFLRDFRGDTVHPSTLALFDDLGLLEPLLERPHQRTERISLTLSDRDYQIIDFTRLDVPAPFIAMMPQWDFLDFVADCAERLPNFRLLRSTKATGLIEDGNDVVGVTADTDSGPLKVWADLCIAADGRDSVLRTASGLPVKKLGAPIDVFWMRLPRDKTSTSDSMGTANKNGFLVLINRGDYWQCALPFLKGSAQTIHAQGLDDFKDRIVAIKPSMATAVDALKSWDDIKLLDVQVDRLEKWWRNGLLCIGDAAHTMSPIGGVGINLAVQDAAAAARILAPHLCSGDVKPQHLKAVQDRRERAARLTQYAQIQAHKHVLVDGLLSRKEIKPPKILSLIDRWSTLQGLTAKAIGMGVTPERWPTDNG